MLNSILVIRQRIIAHIIVSVSVISLPPHRSTTSMPYSDYNKSQLRQTCIINIVNRKACRYIFKKWPRINIRNNRIHFRRVKISRFPHHTIQIGHPIGSLYLKTFRCFPSHLIDRLKIRFLQGHDYLSIPVTNHIYRFLRNSRVRIYQISARRRNTDLM